MQLCTILFNLGRHLVSAETYRYFRLRAFASSVNAAVMWEGQIGFFSVLVVNLSILDTLSIPKHTQGQAG
jgi:hypothetical protein